MLHEETINKTLSPIFKELYIQNFGANRLKNMQTLDGALKAQLPYCTIRTLHMIDEYMRFRKQINL